MELKVFISQDIIDANTERTTSDATVLVRGKPLNLTHEPTYIGFSRKLAAFSKDRRYVELKKTVSSTGEEITWVTVLSNTATSGIFDIFRSMGMYMPKLTVGINETSQTLYTSAKLCRDLNKYSEGQRAAVVMYMLAVAYFVTKAEENLVTFSYDALSGDLKTSNDPLFIANCLRKFTKEETWYLKDSNDDSYTSVKFYNAGAVATNDQYANSEAVRVGVVKNKKGGHAGVVSVALGSVRYTFLLTESVTYTDFDLVNIEISPDSVCSYIANAFEGNINMVKGTIPLNADASLIDLSCEDIKDIAATEKFPKWLTQWLINMSNKGAHLAELDDLQYLCKTYGVCAPEGASAMGALSREEMAELYKDDEYAQELYRQIKPYYDTYQLGADLTANLRGFSNGALYSMAFIGDSGTGKSTAARVIPSRCGIPYISVNFSVNIEEADLFGSMVPNAKKSKPEDPEFVWADGIITKAVRNGYCVILEELNFARPGVLGKLNSLLDENRQIDLSTGEIVRAHPNFRIIATCNIAYEGTNRFNKALVNRFDDVTVFKDLPRTEAINVIKSRTGYSNLVKMSKVYDVYEALKKFAAEQNVNAVVSMRQLLNIFTKGKYYSSAKDAVQRIMINGAFIEDPEYQKVFEETVYAAFDLKFKI